MPHSLKIVGTATSLAALIINLVYFKLNLTNNNECACMKRVMRVAKLENKPQFSFRQLISIIAGI